MFLVVEIVNDKGKKEWKVAPKRWVCTTKNSRRTVLLWPNEMGAERQMHLVKEGICKPMKSWSRQECIVRQECSTYDGANAALQIQQQSEVHLKSMGAFGVVAPEPSAKQDLPESKTSMLASIKTMVESLVQSEARIEKQNARIVKQNANIEEQNARIKKQKSELLKKLASIQNRSAIRGSQHFDLVDNSMKSASFDFYPVETIEQLIDLESNLNDEAFRSKMITWLKFNVVGTQPKKRMSSCLNLLVSRDLLAYCSWTGIVRNGVKQLALKNMQHMLELFQEIGTTPWEKANDTMVATFFKGKVKNAQQRVQSHIKSEKQEEVIVCRDFPQQSLDHADSTDQMYTESIDGESETEIKVKIFQFLVVEIINDKGEKEWKVAPKRWVCTTKNSRRPVLLWPQEMDSERQKQLARDGSTTPTKRSWSRQECVVKRNCPSYDSANAAMKILYSKRLPPSNAPLPLHSNPIIQQSAEQMENAEGNRNVENSDGKLIPAPASQSLQEDEATMLAIIKSMLESLMALHNRIEEQNARIQKQNAEIKEQNDSIEQQRVELMKKLFSMQKRFANFNSQQFDLIDDTMDKTSFEFNIVETAEQLIELENKLNDHSFYSEMVLWLSFNVTGMDPAKRMGRCLELLFSKKMLSKCLWSGINKAGKEQIAIKNRRNILELFKTIGKTPWAIVNDQDIALFFRRKLKSHSKSIEGNLWIDKQGEQLFENIEIHSADSSNAEPHMNAELMEDESEILIEVEIIN
ncbi:uncharacterized protein LOC126575846 [Anopheles aquasalis]|uniref:uncharacterized protein LOC126575846 n=1 Tax=Anopheles aquasalis TaxID=42839 RepID=UPI00215A9CA0|nr:uncharacterized protein LOC126575846 [Anopheles aquasalis]